MTNKFQKLKEDEQVLNPFNAETQKEAYSLFTQLCTAISKFMIEKYPDYNNDLNKKIDQSRIYFEWATTEIENKIKGAEQRIRAEVNTFIKDEFPSLDRSIISRQKELAKQVEKKDELMKEINLKLKKIVDSECLYEDVYKMRDEFKVLQKTVNEFNDRMKKCFGIMNK